MTDPHGWRPTLWQRYAVRSLRRAAGRGAGEPLRPEDWEVAWKLHEHGAGRAFSRLLLALPSGPRCGICGAPFAGPGRWLTGPLGYRPSRKNPTVCATCVEFSPPGGMTMLTGVLFADLRGFTARFDGGDPEEASHILRRFYRCAEDVLFPDAVIDKLIGDEVMALYLPSLKPSFAADEVPALMLAHARGLLRAVGYGSAPRAVRRAGRRAGHRRGVRRQHRAAGALRLHRGRGRRQHGVAPAGSQAAGGEIVLSSRVADALPDLSGTAVELTLKGKKEPQRAVRVRSLSDDAPALAGRGRR